MRLFRYAIRVASNSKTISGKTTSATIRSSSVRSHETEVLDFQR